MICTKCGEMEETNFLTFYPLVFLAEADIDPRDLSCLCSKCGGKDDNS